MYLGTRGTVVPHVAANSSQPTCSREVLVLGTVDSLYEAALNATERTKSPGQLSSGHPVFPVTLPDLTSPPPPLPSPSKINSMAAPLSAAVGSNRPVAAIAAMNNTSGDTTYKSAVSIENVESSRTTTVSVATMESLNKRLEGLTLSNTHLLQQLAEKDTQIQRMIQTLNVQEQELEATRKEIRMLKGQDMLDNYNAKVDESHQHVASESTSIVKNGEGAKNTSESELIISLRKQLDSEKLNSRNMKQQLELERVYANQISTKQKLLYNKINKKSSIHAGTVGNSTSIMEGISQNNYQNSISSTNFGSGYDSFGLQGLLANTAKQQNSTQNANIYEGLVGSDDSFKPVTNHSVNSACISQPSISTSSKNSSSVQELNNRHNGSSILNTTLTPQVPTGLPVLPQNPFSRSEQLIGGLSRSNSTGTPSLSSRNNFYGVSSNVSPVNHSIASSTLGVGGLSLFGLDDTNSLLGGSSIADGAGTESLSNFHSTAGGVNVPSQNSTTTNDDMYKKMANLRYIEMNILINIAKISIHSSIIHTNVLLKIVTLVMNIFFFRLIQQQQSCSSSRTLQPRPNLP